MKPRKAISAGQLDELYDYIDRRLDTIGIETEPRVASKLLELARDPDAELADFSQIIKADASLTGRILRLANSAYFAQRQPVSKLDRALVLLGMDRVKAISMGFYLSRAALADGVRDLSSKVWGESVFRACLCTTIAQRVLPDFSAEAYVIGLMLDCGIPLMAKLMGDEYIDLFNDQPNTPKFFDYEFNHLPYTHVDVAATLCRRWKLPMLLAKPIFRQHTPPPAGKTDEDVLILHRIAYYVGSLTLDTDNSPKQRAPMSTIANKLFALQPTEIEQIVLDATQEYEATKSLFAEFAASIDDVDRLADSVHHQLIDIVDDQIARAVRAESNQGIEKFIIGGRIVEVEVDGAGEAVAYIIDEEGHRLISCTLRLGRESSKTIKNMLGIEEADEQEITPLVTYVNSLAA